MIHFLHEKLFLSLNDKIQGLSIKKKLDFLKESQWWTEEKLISYQEERLHNLMFLFMRMFPFYTDWFNSNNLAPSDICT
ncbi:MAG: hypothetical protein IPJ16_05845 [Bacteroidales bacterium]|nr:hypothetical protein [Bacteroidales bacterium]